MTNESEKRLCLRCKRFLFEVPHGPWSDITPGDDFEMRCAKGHWEITPDCMGSGEDELRRCMAKAKKCEDYDDYRESCEKP